MFLLYELANALGHLKIQKHGQLANPLTPVFITFIGGQDGYIKERLTIKIGENKIKYLDKTIKISNPAVLTDGRVYLPLRAISEALVRNSIGKRLMAKLQASISRVH